MPEDRKPWRGLCAVADLKARGKNSNKEISDGPGNSYCRSLIFGFRLIGKGGGVAVNRDAGRGVTRGTVETLAHCTYVGSQSATARHDPEGILTVMFGEPFVVSAASDAIETPLAPDVAPREAHEP